MAKVTRPLSPTTYFFGMDVFGRNPKGSKGAYFRNNVWWWRPLWDYCLEVGDDIIPREGAMAGQFNDCWGLDEEGARRLGQRLREKLEAGHTRKYAKGREQHLNSLPHRPCPGCHGTGRRRKQPCMTCDGKGQVPPFETEYDFDEDNVRGFAEFLDDSGGFKIC